MEQPQATEESEEGDSGSQVRDNESCYAEGFCPWGKRSPSIMREFIQKPIPFNFPSTSGKMDKDLFRMNSGGIPFTWIDKVLHEGNAQVDIYQAEESGFGFRKPFVVKKVWNKDMEGSNRLFEREWKITKDLRHPHITALLTAFEYQTRLYLGFYPVARCDLGRFMDNMTKDFKNPKIRDLLYREMYPRCKEPPSSDSAPSEEIKKHSNPQEVKAALWPLDLELQGKQDLLRRFLGCLCKAFDYLHKKCSIRHKDIKPGNILIDESGSLLVTDFGISRHFPDNASHVTREQRFRTDFYVSPEMLIDDERDDSSDTFSLGCVFLEMVSLLLGFGIKERPSGLHEHFSYDINEQLKQLSKVPSWTKKLRDVREHPANQQSVTDPNGKMKEGHAGPPEWVELVMNSLDQIELMLSEKKEDRPNLDDLWEIFKRISPDETCEDCMWEPPPQQEANARRSRDERRAIEQRSTRSQDAAWRRPSLGIINQIQPRTGSRSPPIQIIEPFGDAVPLRSQEDVTNLPQSSLSANAQVKRVSVLPAKDPLSPPPQSTRPITIAFAPKATPPPQARPPAKGPRARASSGALQVHDTPNSMYQDDGAASSKSVTTSPAVQLPPPPAETASADLSNIPSVNDYVLCYDKGEKRAHISQYALIAGKRCQ